MCCMYVLRIINKGLIQMTKYNIGTYKSTAVMQCRLQVLFFLKTLLSSIKLKTFSSSTYINKFNIL